MHRLGGGFLLSVFLMVSPAKAHETEPLSTSQPERRPMEVQYSIGVVDSGERAFTGREVLTAESPTLLEQKDPIRDLSIRFSMQVVSEDEAGVLIRVQYEESSAKGFRLKWSPLIQLARGGSTTIGGGRPARSITIKLS
jgi:hypothetical protein